MFTASSYIRAKIWKQPMCPLMDEWIKKSGIHIYIEMLAIKKNEFLPFATTWMDLKGIMLSAMLEKDKYHMISLTCGI